MRNGFTLIELVMITVVLSVLAFWAYSKFSVYEDVKLDGAARKLAADLRFAQNLSSVANTRAGVIFNATGYIVYQSLPASAIANSPGDPCSTDTDRRFRVDFSSGRCLEYNGVTVASTLGTIGFSSVGRPVDAAGNAIIGTDVTVTLTRGLDTSTVTVVNGTGRVSY